MKIIKIQQYLCGTTQIKAIIFIHNTTIIRFYDVDLQIKLYLPEPYIIAFFTSENSSNNNQYEYKRLKEWIVNINDSTINEYIINYDILKEF
ncbi:MAG: hypothetical protein M0P71_07335 [Melioribacteraceae bacterium]|jgi:hypothetical protein|nr:hypothetical protein [Melioribacteraceae bacterium]MDD3982833.1 hypothetical protein [Candidatus Omnitrophota bacterium]